MRHRVAHRKLGRVTEHRLSLLRNQATALLRHERIETTVPKARELRPFVERLITIAKRGLKDGAANGRVLHARRLVGMDVQDVEVVGKLFDSIAPRFEARPGGYTRVLKLGARRGDNAAVAQIELIGSEYNPNLEKSSDEGAPKTPAKSAGGVRGRLRAAASRLRGGKSDKGDTPEGGQEKNVPAPRRRVTTPRKAG
jgi:large subunit ribosomal protein L17